MLISKTTSVHVFSSVPVLLRYLASLAIIALVWYEYLWAFVAFVWPLSYWHSLLHFGFAAAEGGAFAAVGRTDHWLRWLAAMVAVWAGIRLANLVVVHAEQYVPAKRHIYRRDMATERLQILAYLLIAALFLVIGLSFGPHVSNAWNLIAAGSVLCIALLLAVKTERDLHRNMCEFLKGSPWGFHRRQIYVRRARLDGGAKRTTRGAVRERHAGGPTVTRSGGNERGDTSSG